MRKMKNLLTLFCTLLMPALAVAQPLSIEQCRELALQQNREKKNAGLLTQQAEFTMKSTRAMFMPAFSLVAAGVYDTDKGSQDIEGGLLPVVDGNKLPVGTFAYFPGLSLDYKVGSIVTSGIMMKQPLYMGGKIQAGYRMSKLAVDLYRQNERMTEAEVIQKADEAYAKVVNAKELVQVAEKYRVLLNELDKNVESAIRHGLKMENDRMKVQVKINEVELQLRKAQNGVRLATMNLCHVTGQPLNSEIEVSSEYPAVEDALTLQTTDITARPEYAMLNYQTRIANEQVKMTRSEMMPQLALLAKYGYTHGIEFNNKTLVNGWNFAGGVTLSVPLYHFGEHTNKVKAAKAKLEQTQNEQENKREMMLLELTQAANNMDEARLEVTLCEKSLEQAQTHMKLSEQQYKAGTVTLSEHLEAQAQWQTAYESQINAHFQLYLASVNYLRASGSLVR